VHLPLEKLHSGLSPRFITSRPPQRHYIALAAFRHRKDMLGPKIERLALLGRVGGAVVDSGDASLVAADMIEHRFDNMRQYSKFDNPGGDRAADVMQSPGLQFEFLVSLPHLGEDAPIKRALGIAPALEQPIPDCGGAFAACVGVHPTVKADSGDFRVSFTDGGGAIEVSGRLKSAKSVERLIKALEAGKTLFEMIGPDNKDEAVN
jgi:hypothetical protein